jgi:hypothetical protein
MLERSTSLNNIYTLYIKTHRKTGLKYFGQTKKSNPYKYKGSGYDWVEHITEHGYDVDTEIILQCTDINDRNYWGRYYSNLWKIKTAMDDFGNKIWANRIPETGSGGGRKAGFKMRAESKNTIKYKMTGKKQSLDTCQKRSDSMTDRFKNNSQ